MYITAMDTTIIQTKNEHAITDPLLVVGLGVCVCVTHVEGELAREVVHATGVHEAQRVPDGLGAQHTLARDWTEAAVGQRGRHDTGALTGHLDGAQLQEARAHTHLTFPLNAVLAKPIIKGTRCRLLYHLQMNHPRHAS